MVVLGVVVNLAMARRLASVWITVSNASMHLGGIHTRRGADVLAARDASLDLEVVRDAREGVVLAGQRDPVAKTLFDSGQNVVDVVLLVGIGRDAGLLEPLGYTISMRSGARGRGVWCVPGMCSGSGTG